MAIPRPLRSQFLTATGKQRTHVEESLGTGDRRAACALRDIRVAEWRVKFRARERGGVAAAQPIMDRATHHRESLRLAANSDSFEALHGFAVDEAHEIERQHGEEAARQFARLAFEVEVPTMREAWKEWMGSSEHEASTRLKYRQAFEEFMGFLAVPDARLRDITRKQTQGYADWLNTEAKSQRDGGPLAHRSKGDRVRALGSFWTDYVERRELVPHGRGNPWQGLLITGRRKSTGERDGEKRAYRQDELLSLINGPEMRESEQTRYTKRTLTELLALGLFTGARLNEICSLSLSDVEEIPGGYRLCVERSKTGAGLRSLPVLHAIPVGILRARIGDRDTGQLFKEFIPGGPGKKLSWYAGKALGRYRDQVRLGTETDFHSTRRTLITRLEELEADPLSAARYAGHKVPGMTFGLYSKGSESQLLKIAQTIRYEKEIEEALERTLQVDRARHDPLQPKTYPLLT